MPITDMAGELWLLLLQLAGKKKRSEDCLPRIRTPENREMIQDFIESGARLTDKIKNMLKACEKTAWELANIQITDGWPQNGAFVCKERPRCRHQWHEPHR